MSCEAIINSGAITLVSDTSDRLIGLFKSFGGVQIAISGSGVEAVCQLGKGRGDNIDEALVDTAGNVLLYIEDYLNRYGDISETQDDYLRGVAREIEKAMWPSEDRR